MLKKLALVVALMCGCAIAQQTAGTTTPTLVPGEVYSTGNLVQMTTTTSGSTWTNAVYQDQLSCMAMGMPGNCGPNPSVRPGNLINYSYGLTDIYQQVQLANSATLAVPGLRVNGYNFGFLAKNGNGWDDGRVDQLNAYVAFYGTDGKVKDYTNYDLNSKFDWTQFNYTKDFVSPYSITELSNVRYGFVGMDNNFWAGNYGPEIYNISFSLKYSVDPCANDPLYSPTCPGYMDALNKLLPPAPANSTTTVDPVVSTVASPTTVVTEPVAVQTTAPTTTATVGQPTVVAAVVSAPAPVTSTPTATTSSTTSTSSSSTVQVTKESTPSSGGNVSLALSIISKNQDRDAAGSAVAQAAVSQAQAAANQAQQEAQSVAASAVSNSISANAVSSTGQQSNNSGTRTNANNSNSTNFTLQSGQTNLATVISGPQTSNNAVVQQQSGSTSINIMNSQPAVVSTYNTQQSTATTFALPLLQPQQPMVSAPIVPVFQTEQPQQTQALTQNNNRTTQTTETYSIVPPIFLTDKSNPLTDIIEGKQNIPQNNTIASTGPSVNRNAKDNELAGGVDLNKMALAPTGYGDYLNFTLRDASFYAPKEVYRNQRNVDNVRALRLLTNDSRHKDMVEMQYAR